MKKWMELVVIVVAGGGLLTSNSAMGADTSENPSVMVYKSPTCGCCSKWIEHLEGNGFEVRSKDIADVTPVKRMNGVPGNLASCHTAIVGGYFVEGHVPAEDVMKLLEERPEIAGLAVPRMPVGSPGMEGPNPVAYSVLAVKKDGSVEVFSSHGP